MKTGFFCAFTFGLLLLITGCETTSTTARSKASQEQIFLRKGMSGAEVKSLLGEPLSIKKGDVPAEEFETWVYEDSRERTIPVQADTRDVPYTNPITRETTTITEAVTKLKTERTTLTTLLFISHGKLIGWKESTEESSWFQN